MAIGHVDSFVCANSPSNRVRLLFAIKSKIEDRNSYLLINLGWAKLFCVSKFVKQIQFFLFPYLHTCLCECVPRKQTWDNQTNLNTFNQPQISFWLQKLATKNMHLATRFLQLVTKRQPKEFFNFEPWNRVIIW